MPAIKRLRKCEGFTAWHEVIRAMLSEKNMQHCYGNTAGTRLVWDAGARRAVRVIHLVPL